jgi:hypothetical protein
MRFTGPWVWPLNLFYSNVIDSVKDRRSHLLYYLTLPIQRGA